MAQPSRQELLATVPVKRAVMILALPTIISQIINVIYNLADVFFVGQIGDPLKVAGVSVVMPAFMITTVLGNLFGIGGSSAISRAIGKGDMELAKKHTTFCFYGGMGAAALYSLLLIFFIKPFLRLYGASDATLPYAIEYTTWVLIVGSIPTVCNVTMAHMLRADGKPRIASIGLSMGGILNIILDPLFILVFRLEVLGVALATLLSNTIALIFFLAYWVKHKQELVITLNPRNLFLKKEVFQPVLVSGIPAAVQTLVVSLFFMFVNRRAAIYGDIHVAAMGIVNKMDQVPQYVSLGLAQAIIPLLGYNYGAENYERMDAVSKFAMSCAVAFSLVCVAVYVAFAPTLVTWFIPESPETIRLGALFVRVMCFDTPLMAFCNVMNSTFQATAQAKQALSICLFRRVYVGLPMLYLLDWLFPVTGFLIAATVVDAIAAFYVLYLYRKFKGEIIAAREEKRAALAAQQG
ncbi:MAG: MATE family efflux transporter [Clostridia bacterium]|nr:MATE family efflux transporter [Clostridia bacterium]